MRDDENELPGFDAASLLGEGGLAGLELTFGDLAAGLEGAFAFAAAHSGVHVVVGGIESVGASPVGTSSVGGEVLAASVREMLSGGHCDDGALLGLRSHLAMLGDGAEAVAVIVCPDCGMSYQVRLAVTHAGAQDAAEAEARSSYLRLCACS